MLKRWKAENLKEEKAERRKERANMVGVALCRENPYTQEERRPVPFAPDRLQPFEAASSNTGANQ